MNQDCIKYLFLIRICDQVFSNHNSSRPFNASKDMIIKKTLLSLKLASEGFKVEFQVIADNCSDKIISFVKNNITKKIHITNGGASVSLQKQLEIAAAQQDNTWIYFCEDDYLHHPESIKRIDDLISNRDEYLRMKSPFLSLNSLIKRDLIIHLADYPDRYLESQIKNTILFKSKFCHWRLIDKTTHSFMMEAKTVKKYFTNIYKSTIGPSDAQLSKRVYGGVYSLKPICLSPIQGLSSHLTEGVMSPFVDWEGIWNQTTLKKI